ncbi:efflux RND transporter permease subunit [Chondromyces apiculatus]|uniref:Cobalt-zinc-cadmium resistance protein CzcA/ Cation efflux system protein CusA n=1 Tax=Chondromyces apiculatus DSM 436 TaxID=1192034 RepID=A0A017T7G9_9BACT|nr:efflux RND transporter permease subunit [Chondromyces apiculatus]EYF05174.1 Cobalt-zinc-cadmium resistance protein CzcA/ Cation efflux system protein CusA [Chondromyces apiculatus DSM 436]
MWLVITALKRPYTFIVMSMLIVIMGVFTIFRMPTDIFPNIDIPVISVIFNYGGLPPEEMEKRVVNNYERFLTTVVNDIEHVESQSLTGISIVKVFLQPGASVDAAIAQITAASQSSIRQMPTGMTPPLVIRYSASNVPIMQAALESESMSEQQLFDYGVNFIRADIATIKGTQIPWPYGGKQRQIMVDIDPQRLYAWGLSARDVNTALGLQNVILPAGSAKMGTNEYPVIMNSSPAALEELGSLPIKSVDGKTVYVRDVANIRDGNSPQQSMVHVNGKRSVLMTILKAGSASTLEVAARIREMLPGTMAKLPKELKATLLFDQSLFVRASVNGVVHEALIAAGLTALMILLFLGSWRSTLIVVISIPLSILVSIIVLDAMGHTLNTMTLGGMSLAVGILVDDATVAIENIHRNLGQRKPFIRAIVDGAQEIAVPALVATLCICIVFVPVAFITGAARSLFIPLALAVVFAMLMSYVLSRTLVPTMVRLLLEREAEEHAHGDHGKPAGFFGRIHAAFNRGFDRLRTSYGRILAWALAHRVGFVIGFGIFVAASVSLLPLLGQDFFPSVDAGLIKLHVRGTPGTRLEETERNIAHIEETIREVIPPAEIDTLIDNLGIPASGINLSLSEGALISSADGQISISLKHGHAPTAGYVKQLRDKLNATYPETTFFFLPPDITTQVLNFGLPAPINVQVVGPIGKEAETYGVAVQIAERMKNIPGAVDVHLAQVNERPQLRIDVDRTMADQLGLSQRDVASDILVSLSSSGQVSPSYWLDKRGVQYLVAVQTPQYAVGSFDEVNVTPLSTGNGQPQFLSNVAQVSRGTGPVNVTHYNVARTFDVQANVEGTDLGSVASAVNSLIDGMKDQMPRGTKATLKGQVESMTSSFRGLGYGLIFAVVLVYLLMVVNFQSWMDPLIILMALPGALSGIAWMLFLSGTTLSVPALMGSIMCVGVATANSILVVTFANDQRQLGRDATTAALASGMTRLRPVIMTAFAMIIGMLPMSTGLGEGGEQNAPLGRAVIGGLLVATVTTLFFVPVMYSILRKKAPATDPLAENL